MEPCPTAPSVEGVDPRTSAGPEAESARTAPGSPETGMTRSRSPTRRRSTLRGRRGLPGPTECRFPRALEGVLLVTLATVMLVGLFAGSGSATVRGSELTPAAMSGPSPSTAVEYVNVTATSALSFAPNQFTVTSGALVRLIVTQAANFPHTFVLSPVANFAFPPSDTTAQLDAFFQNHTPLVNLTLGSVVGSRAYANFTAPPAGTYEFVCVIPYHFAGGMYGTMTSAMAATGPAPIPWTLIVGVGVVIAAVVVGIVVALRRRTPRSPPPTSPSPPA
jgi:uncharacterized cupredoxin-like copper-binding protein